MVNDRHSFSIDHDEHINNYEFDMQPAKAANKRHDGSGMSTFKLADEAQMGGLSCLMAGVKCANNNNSFMANSMEVDEEKDDEKGRKNKLSIL